MRLENGPRYKIFTWNGTYFGERIKYENQQTIETQAGGLNVRQLLTPVFGLLASGGYEYYDSRTLDIGDVFKGPSWSIGFDWNPSVNTHLAASGGERFFGNTGSFEFSHRTRLTTWGASYSEDVTTTRTEFFVPVTTDTRAYLEQLYTPQYPDPATREKEVQEFINRTGLPPNLTTSVNFFTTQLYLLKRGQGSAGFLGANNAVIATVFKETREQLQGQPTVPGSGDFATSNNIDQNGASLVWTLRLSARNAWTLSSAYHRNYFPQTGRLDKIVFVRMGIARRLWPNMVGSINYRRQMDDSNEDQYDYTENAVYATLHLGF